jgi:hypothetical protein
MKMKKWKKKKKLIKMIINNFQLNKINFKNKIKTKYLKNIIKEWGLGIGDLGIGDWGLGPIPNPQSPIPNPQSPYSLIIFFKYFVFILFLKLILLN